MKMILVKDCGECQESETIRESESYKVERFAIYCSHPTLDSPIIFETRNDTRPPNWTIPDWCPLMDAPVETDDNDNVQCRCPDHWKECESGSGGACKSMRLGNI